MKYNHDEKYENTREICDLIYSYSDIVVHFIYEKVLENIYCFQIDRFICRYVMFK